jgi:oxygen-independent coproporphyrinogen-3 oxidase
MARTARAGRRRRNFQGYTTDPADVLVGLGASAIAAGQFATAKGRALSADDRVRGRIIEQLMCDLAVDLDATAGPADFSAELDEIDALSASGIVRREGRFVIITEMGRPFVRLVAAAFDAYLPRHRARHSVAV